MSNIEIPHLPITSRVLNTVEGVAEGAWHRFGKTLPGHILLGSGSTSPALIEVKWNDCPQIDPDEVDWCNITGDPEAGIGNIPRHWENVAVIGADRDSLPCGRDPQGWGWDAVICLSEGRVKIGTKPNSYRLFGSTNGDCSDSAQAIVAICRSRGLIKVSPVMLEPDGEIVIPEDTSILEKSIPTAQVTRFAGISLLRAPQVD